MAVPLVFPTQQRALLAQYLHLDGSLASHDLAGGDAAHPHVTLTYAQSMDGKVSAAPGVRTAISGPETKAMTHYLRSQHDAILVGSGTAIADDPALNCRLSDARHQPQPVILDRRGRWAVTESSAVIQRARDGTGKAPWIFVAREGLNSRVNGHAASGHYVTDAEWDRRRGVVEGAGGRIIEVAIDTDLTGMLRELANLAIRSVMIEGGATIIQELLTQRRAQNLVNSVIVTVGPVLFGPRGQEVLQTVYSVDGKVPLAQKPVRFTDVKWMTLGEDAVMLGRLERQD